MDLESIDYNLIMSTDATDEGSEESNVKTDANAEHSKEENKEFNYAYNEESHSCKFFRHMPENEEIISKESEEACNSEEDENKSKVNFNL